MSLTDFQKASFRQHTHLASQIKDENGGDAISAGGGQAAIDAAIAAHDAAGDPHPIYLTQAEADALYAAVSARSPTVTTLGKTAVGGSSEATGNFRVYCKKITIAAKTLILGASMYVTPNAGGNVAPLAAAIALDNSGTPGRIIALSAPLTPDLAGETSSPVARWVHVPLGIVLGGSAIGGGNADYWIEYAAGPGTNAWTVFYDGSGSDKYYGSSGSWFFDGAIASFTSPAKDYSLFVDTMAVA